MGTMEDDDEMTEQRWARVFACADKQRREDSRPPPGWHETWWGMALTLIVIVPLGLLWAAVLLYVFVLSLFGGPWWQP